LAKCTWPGMSNSSFLTESGIVLRTNDRGTIHANQTAEKDAARHPRCAAPACQLAIAYGTVACGSSAVRRPICWPAVQTKTAPATKVKGTVEAGTSFRLVATGKLHRRCQSRRVGTRPIASERDAVKALRIRSRESHWHLKSVLVASDNRWESANAPQSWRPLN
jgi:hypothetical protein